MSRSTRTGYNLRNTESIDHRKNEYKVTLVDTSNVTNTTVLQGTGASVLTEFVHERNDETSSVSSAEEFQAASAANSQEKLKIEFKSDLQNYLDEVHIAWREEIRTEVQEEVSRSANRLHEAIDLNYSSMDSLSDNAVKHTDLAQITEQVRGQLEADLRALAEMYDKSRYLDPALPVVEFVAMILRQLPYHY
ncbi:hypothetical protein PR048_014957 [Dryococelus australis]|uniref:Uncharacterized protein n=1 Tax=Dryococelus australis TaxID=614101 RepID=A0ABQ9HFU6_9NEOP|nr:hypothetical protein PR048_014957 [Dryococelus australis]